MKYYRIKRDIKTEARRAFVSDNLINLKKELKDRVPKKDLDSNLLIATWNIRDFDSNKFGHGPRLKESYF